ncbi:hypothetical protein [Sphaerisporangium dianthi]|uniref:Uncharacterized protein n=1 Tax=Sphaerisporangium dianthi TaxID=1436120 RepID=A0ABV9CTW9_9ACTN
MRNATGRHRVAAPPAQRSPGARWPACAALLITVAAVVASPQAPASAAAAPWGARASLATGDRGPIVIGNGRRNLNYSQVMSPTNMRGVQHVSNASVTGNAPSQVGFCRKRHRICHISEKFWIKGRR